MLRLEKNISRVPVSLIKLIYLSQKRHGILLDLAHAMMKYHFHCITSLFNKKYMSKPISPVKNRPWLPELSILFGLMLLTTLIFWNTNLDLNVAQYFYEPANPLTPWPESQNSLWKFFYHAAPLFTGLILLGSIGILMFVRKPSREHHRLRLYSVYLLLLVIFGPGFIINGVFKGYWGRPRPGDTIELGGTQKYIPPLKMGQSQEYKSFPAGHASVGFVFVGFFFILRRRRKYLARAALVFSTLFGLLIGAGRIVEGGHYLSDVLWAGFLTFLTASLLYHFVMKFPVREDRIENSEHIDIPPLGLKRSFGYLSLFTAMVIASLLASPITAKTDQKIKIAAANHFPVVNYHLDEGNVVLKLVDDPAILMSIKGSALGFGLPTNKVNAVLENHKNIISGVLEHKGIFTELVSNYVIKINLDKISSFNLQNLKGTITVANKLTSQQRARLHLNLVNGKISWTR